MTVPAAVVRAMTAADVEAAASREAASRALPWSADGLRAQLGLRRAAAWTVETAGADGVRRAAGHALRWLVVDEAELLTLVVDPGQRRRGLGRRLLEHVLQEVARNGARVLRLEVSEGNVGALALYASSGFVPIGRRADYYGPGDDALVLEREL